MDDGKVAEAIAKKVERKRGPKPIPNRLKELRKASGLTVQEIADAAHITVNHYRKLEDSVVPLRLEYMTAFADIFRIGLEEILRKTKPSSEGSVRLRPADVERPYRDVGDRLRLMMKARRLRSVDVEERLDIKSGKWANYVVGANMPPRHVIRELLVYGISADWLLFGDERNLTYDFATALARHSKAKP
jgi:DNA-binding XRE family transcriptional regulator